MVVPGCLVHVVAQATVPVMQGNMSVVVCNDNRLTARDKLLSGQRLATAVQLPVLSATPVQFIRLAIVQI